MMSFIDTALRADTVRRHGWPGIHEVATACWGWIPLA